MTMPNGQPDSNLNPTETAHGTEQQTHAVGQGPGYANKEGQQDVHAAQNAEPALKDRQQQEQPQGTVQQPEPAERQQQQHAEQGLEAQQAPTAPPQHHHRIEQEEEQQHSSGGASQPRLSQQQPKQQQQQQGHQHDEQEQEMQEATHGDEQGSGSHEAAQESQQEQEMQEESQEAGQEPAAAAGGPSGSSLLVRFYRDGARDVMGRTLQDMLRYDDDWMEMCHDHMQWMFPLHEPSAYSLDAQVLTQRDIQELSTSPVARANMAAALTHFRAFMGIGVPPQPKKWREWARFGNHNLLRVTRVLRSLRLFGMTEEAAQLYESLLQVGQKHKPPERTLQFWAAAVQDSPTDSIRGVVRTGRPRDEAASGAASTVSGGIAKYFKRKT